jgi:hypothetical protein
VRRIRACVSSKSELANLGSLSVHSTLEIVSIQFNFVPSTLYVKRHAEEASAANGLVAEFSAFKHRYSPYARVNTCNSDVRRNYLSKAAYIFAIYKLTSSVLVPRT